MVEFLRNIILVTATITSSFLGALNYQNNEQTNLKKIAPKKIISEISPTNAELDNLQKQLAYLFSQLTITPSPVSETQLSPTNITKQKPSTNPTHKPTLTPTLTIVLKPTKTPAPSNTPTLTPTKAPTKTPTPTLIPTITPTPTNFPIPTLINQKPQPQGLNADLLYAMVNDYRKTNSLTPFTKDETTCAVAQNRAPQLYDEIYGATPMHAGLKAMNLSYWVNENIINFTTGQDAFNWWINDKIHREVILSDYKYSCTACYGYSCSQIFTNYIPK